MFCDTEAQPTPRRKKLESGSFTLEIHVFRPHYAGGTTSTVFLELSFRKTSAGKSHDYRDAIVPKGPFSKCFSSTIKTKIQRFQIPSVWRAFATESSGFVTGKCVDGRPNRRKKSTFPNPSVEGWTRPKNNKVKINRKRARMINDWDRLWTTIVRNLKMVSETLPMNQLGLWISIDNWETILSIDLMAEGVLQPWVPSRIHSTQVIRTSGRRDQSCYLGFTALVLSQVWKRKRQWTACNTLIHEKYYAEE